MNAKSQSRGSSLVTPSDALNSGAIIRVKGELHAHSYEVQVQVRERHLSQEEDREIALKPLAKATGTESALE
jgi:hypothetical protein